MKKILLYIFLFTFKIQIASDILIPNPYAHSFKKAYSLFPTIPFGILESVAFTQSRFNHLTSNENASCTNMPQAYSIMGLIEDGKGYFRNNLGYVSQLSGYSIEAIKKEPEISILAYAKAFSILQNNSNNFSRNPSAYISILIQLSELPMLNDVTNDFVMNSHLYQLFWFLSKGEFQEQYNFPDYQISLSSIFGTNYEVLRSSSIIITNKNISDSNGNVYKNSQINSPDYGPALWNPTSCNFSSRAGTQISAIAIHDIEGSYAGCISWFKNCSANASAHYVIRSSDGQITQMVYEADKAWHIASENPYTLGIEHEGYSNNSSWYTTAMYNASAALVKDMCTDNLINPLRCYFGPGCSGTTQQCLQGACIKIKGHQMFPNQTHSDPGPYWNWDKYYKLINNTYSVTTYTASNGNFYDSGGPTGNYSNDERKLWLFTKPGATNITLSFSSFNTEKNYDYLFIYDGGSVYSPLIGKFSGTVNPGPITSTNDSLLVEFRSDCATIAAGWVGSYTTNVGTTTAPDIISPTTSITSTGAWQTSNFIATYSDKDNPGGSGIEKGYYQVIDYDGTEWRANYTHGFFADNFDNSIHNEWTQKTGSWSILGNALVQNDETSTVSGNTNIYAALTQTLSNRYLYQFLAKFEGLGTNRRAGLHFFCDQPDSTNRNNSYFVWFRLDDQKIQIYKVVNNNFGTPVFDQPLSFTAGQWYDIKIIYDRISGKISVYMNNSKIANWIDPSPYSNGNYISFRSGNCKFSVDEIKVYRSRSNTTNVSLGPGMTNDIRYQNPNPLTYSAKIKSICQDSAENLSPIYYHDLNIDWTPPSNLIQVNDGKGADINFNCNLDSLSANWIASLDSNSSISNYRYSIGTNPGATDVLGWTNNQSSTSVTTHTISITQNTNYYFNIQAENGAGLVSNIISSDGQKADTTCNAIGIIEIKNDNRLFVYPNPFKDELNLYLLFKDNSTISIQLFDALGRIIENRSIKYSTSNFHESINTLNLNPGIYFLQVNGAKTNRILKIIKN